MSMNTATIDAANAIGSSRGASSRSAPPISGNTANVAAFHSALGSGRRQTASATTTDASAIAAAGSGPSSAIASTSAANEPDRRAPRKWIVIASPATAITSNAVARTNTVKCVGRPAQRLDVRVQTLSEGTHARLTPQSRAQTACAAIDEQAVI